MPDANGNLTHEDLHPCPCGEEPHPVGRLDVCGDSRGAMAVCEACGRVGPRSTEPDDWPRPGSFSEAVKLWNEAIENGQQLQKK
jgi:hypothetical protein